MDDIIHDCKLYVTLPVKHVNSDLKTSFWWLRENTFLMPLKLASTFNLEILYYSDSEYGLMLLISVYILFHTVTCKSGTSETSKQEKYLIPKDSVTLKFQCR